MFLVGVENITSYTGTFAPLLLVWVSKKVVAYQTSKNAFLTEQNTLHLHAKSVTIFQITVVTVFLQYLL